jgi:2-oxoglutarate dehydrogenase E2 component (dihydrolipoamide succinyltransferase)
VPSEVSGTLIEILFQVNDVVKVGQTIAIIETAGVSDAQEATVLQIVEPAEVLEKSIAEAVSTMTPAAAIDFSNTDKFYSPLIKNIAKKENISTAELDAIIGSGKDGRVTKDDVMNYLSNKSQNTANQNIEPVNIQPTVPAVSASQKAVETPKSSAPVSVNGQDEIIEMDRMRKMISHHMVASVQTSAHVQSFIEVDVTNIVKWREKVKASFEKREGEKLTFTPIFMEAVAKAIKDFPMINISVDGDYIIKKKNINLGMAAALANGNLIVPVIKNADQLNLVGMTKQVNDLANRARNNQLKPDDIQGGTYTVTNVGTFGSVFGTPIISQPQVAILALGAIRKVPAVIETPEGDFIGIRHKMFLSHSYDHRVVDGALGGSFVKRVAEYLEKFDTNRDF